jgi:hypothetical protein
MRLANEMDAKSNAESKQVREVARENRNNIIALVINVNRITFSFSDVTLTLYDSMS